ncbi:MAG: tripartite tricarboxylate transporter permease, partial [Peptococcales bacterium]
MTQLINLIQGFNTIFTSFEVLLPLLMGIIVGVILGAIPGLSSTVGIALVIPFSYYLSPLAAVSMMYAIHKTGTYGGSITAILLNTPGTPAAACTQLDGYPLTKMGKAGKALKVAVISSAIGDFLSDLLLIFASIYVANLVWLVGPVEIVAILFFALIIISGLTGESPMKGLFSACLGLIFSLVGRDPANLSARFTFGYYELDSGLSLISVLTGLFILSEVFIQCEIAKKDDFTNQKIDKDILHHGKKDDDNLSLSEFKSIIPAISLSTIIGTIIGILPGLGAAVAPFVSYGQVKSLSKNPEKFGKGAIEGIAAAEASNNAVCGANLIPLFTFGIPGSTDAALMMGVFMINGIEFGPRIFIDHTKLVYGIFAAGLIAILGYFIIGMTLSKHIGYYVTKLSPKILYPIVMIICFIGVYT